MPPEILTHTKKHSAFVFLDRDDADDEALGRVLSQLILNWARLDFALLRVLMSKDNSEPAKWVQILLKPHFLSQRVEVLKKELAEISDADDEFRDLLNDTFKGVDVLREKRNLLVHGLWVRESREAFQITPMALDTEGKLPPPVRVERSEIHDLFRQVQATIESLAQLRSKVRHYMARENSFLPASITTPKS